MYLCAYANLFTDIRFGSDDCIRFDIIHPFNHSFMPIYPSNLIYLDLFHSRTLCYCDAIPVSIHGYVECAYTHNVNQAFIMYCHLWSIYSIINYVFSFLFVYVTYWHISVIIHSVQLCSCHSFIWFHSLLHVIPGGGGSFRCCHWTGVRGWSRQSRHSSLRVIHWRKRVPIHSGVWRKRVPIHSGVFIQELKLMNSFIHSINQIIHSLGV